MEDEREGGRRGVVWKTVTAELWHAAAELRKASLYGKGRNEVSSPPSTIGKERLYGAQRPNNVSVGALSSGC